MQPVWILALIFMAACGVIYALADVTSRRQRRVYERLSRLAWERALPVANAPEETPAGEAPRDLLPFVSQALERGGLGERLKWLLSQAGLSLRPGEFAVGMVLAAALGFTVGVVQGDRVLGGMLAVIGAMAPPAAVVVLRSRRMGRFNDQLADALLLIASSIRSGYGFLRAMQAVAAEFPDPVRQEFERTIREAEIGSPIPAALQNMLRRVPNYDLELAVTAVSIQIQVGGNLAEVLDTIAETVRGRVRTRRQIAALTAEGKMSGWIAFVVPWVMFGALKLLNPEYMKPLFTAPIGMILLGAAFGLQLIGGFWIWRILSMEL